MGNGAAVGASIGINPIGGEWRGAARCWTVDRGEKLYVGIYVDTDAKDVFGQYEIGLAYFDCLGCQYMQKFEMNVAKLKEKDRPFVRLSFYGPRILLSDEERKRILGDQGDFIYGYHRLNRHFAVDAR